MCLNKHFQKKKKEQSRVALSDEQVGGPGRLNHKALTSSAILFSFSIMTLLIL